MTIAFIVITAALLVEFKRRAEILAHDADQPVDGLLGAFEPPRQIVACDRRAPVAQEIMELVDAVEFVQRSSSPADRLIVDPRRKSGGKSPALERTGSGLRRLAQNTLEKIGHQRPDQLREFGLESRGVGTGEAVIAVRKEMPFQRRAARDETLP